MNEEEETNPPVITHPMRVVIRIAEALKPLGYEIKFFDARGSQMKIIINCPGLSVMSEAIGGW
jgi:hypothetical protein